MSTGKPFYSQGKVVSIDTRPQVGWSEVQLTVGARDFSPKCPDWLWDPYSLLFNR
jgi:hypothetical protein